jgi:hypothetical protein
MPKHIGLVLQRILPESSTTGGPRDMIGAFVGLLTLLSALTMGLLIWTAYGVYAGQNIAIQALAAKALQLDLALADYGPEAKNLRLQLRDGPGGIASATAGRMRSPRFRRLPFVRDGVFDHGRASAPRKTAPHMLPSAVSTDSASARLALSRLNGPPHTIAVYASRRSSPSAPQHSLPSARYGLLGPDLHRLDAASFAWRTDTLLQWGPDFPGL